MSNYPNLSKKQKRELRRRHEQSLTAGMSKPHKIRITCDGTEKHPHKESQVVVVYVDAASGRYVIDDDKTTGNPDNFAGKRAGVKRWERVPTYQGPAPDDKDNAPEYEAFRKIMDQMAGGNMAPSHNAEHIFCAQCNRKVEMSVDKFAKLVQQLAALHIEVLWLSRLGTW